MQINDWNQKQFIPAGTAWSSTSPLSSLVSYWSPPSSSVVSESEIKIQNKWKITCDVITFQLDQFVKNIIWWENKSAFESILVKKAENKSKDNLKLFTKWSMAPSVMLFGNNGKLSFCSGNKRCNRQWTGYRHYYFIMFSSLYGDAWWKKLKWFSWPPFGGEVGGTNNLNQNTFFIPKEIM